MKLLSLDAIKTGVSKAPTAGMHELPTFTKYQVMCAVVRDMDSTMRKELVQLVKHCKCDQYLPTVGMTVGQFATMHILN
jgi:putative lipoic acid-binding regulatory protein